jgi:hypothetical protein
MITRRWGYGAHGELRVRAIGYGINRSGTLSIHEVRSVMSSRNSSIAPVLILMLGSSMTSSAAHSTVHEGRHRNVPGAYSDAARQPWDRSPHVVARRAGYAAPVPSGAHVGPAYVFVPGRGILGEDCDMPTSTCPNELRDTP